MDLEFLKLFGGVSGPLLQHLESSHTTTSQVAQVAQRAGVRQLVLTHLVPSNPVLIPDLVWQLKCSAGFSGRVHVGNDLDRIPMPVRRG